MTDNLPVTAPISSLDAQITAVRNQLIPAGAEIVAERVRSLLRAGMPFPSTMDQQAAPEAYAFALAGFSATALTRCCAKLLRGEYPRAYPGLIPAPPELATLVRGEEAVLRREGGRLDEMRRMQVERAEQRARHALSDEERARRAALVARGRDLVRGSVRDASEGDAHE